MPARAGFFVRNLKVDHPATPIVLVGYLNIQGEEAEVLLLRLGLSQARPEDEHSFYSLTEAAGWARSWIDHIAST